MKKLLGVLGSIGAFLLLLVAMAIGKVAGKAVVTSATEPDLATVLPDVASKLNSTLPMMVDKDTRLDTTYGGPGKNFTYFYTLPGYASSDLDPVAVHDAIAPHVRGNVCGNKEMREMFQAGVTAHYVYRGNDGTEVARLDISPVDCGISP